MLPDMLSRHTHAQPKQSAWNLETRVENNTRYHSVCSWMTKESGGTLEVNPHLCWHKFWGGCSRLCQMYEVSVTHTWVQMRRGGVGKVESLNDERMDVFHHCAEGIAWSPWRRSVNTKGVFLCTRLAVPSLSSIVVWCCQVYIQILDQLFHVVVCF